MTPVHPRFVAALAALLILVIGGGTAVAGSDAGGTDLASALLVAEDLPTGLASAAGVTHEPVFDYDQASFQASGGRDRVAQTWQAAQVVAGDPVVIVFDFRFLFPSADAAQAYLDAAEPILSESVSGITLQADTPAVGEVLRRYAGSLSQGDVTVDVQNFLFRIGPVVAKVYIGGFGTTLDDALPIAQAAAARIDASLAGQPVASPVASPVAQGTSGDIGRAVRYVDRDGVERGTVTVEAMTDPFVGSDPKHPPETGMRFVQLTVAFQASDQSYQADPRQIVLQDSDGFVWGAGDVRRPKDATPPDLKSQKLAAGAADSGVVGYVVPSTASIDRILYRPDSGRLILLADLLATSGPSLGDIVSLTAADGGAATVTAQLADPFHDFAPDRPPKAGTRYAVATVVFTNIGQLPFSIDPADLTVRDAGGYLWSRSDVRQADQALIPPLSKVTLASGDRISGVVGFAVPETAALSELDIQLERGRLVTVAALAASGKAEESPAASAAP